jgi:hypothetical protein
MKAIKGRQRRAMIKEVDYTADAATMIDQVLKETEAGLKEVNKNVEAYNKAPDGFLQDHMYYIEQNTQILGELILVETNIRHQKGGTPQQIKILEDALDKTRESILKTYPNGYDAFANEVHTLEPLNKLP